MAESFIHQTVHIHFWTQTSTRSIRTALCPLHSTVLYIFQVPQSTQQGVILRCHAGFVIATREPVLPRLWVQQGICTLPFQPFNISDHYDYLKLEKCLFHYITRRGLLYIYVDKTVTRNDDLVCLLSTLFLYYKATNTQIKSSYLFI